MPNPMIFEVYEVFIQKNHNEFHTHVGSLLATNPELALQLARENYMRREAAIQLWVVPRSQIIQSSSPDFLVREMDHKYREVAGYTENGRLWRMFKEKAITLEEIVEYVEQNKNKRKKSKGES
jgi:ring-1,2-phenylacetyl-CoA epoxidase subunit PaaB